MGPSHKLLGRYAAGRTRQVQRQSTIHIVPLDFGFHQATTNVSKYSLIFNAT